MQTKVLLIYPETGFDFPETLLMPLSILALAPSLERNGIKPHIIDQRTSKNWRDELKDSLNRDGPLCVGISSMTGTQITGAIEASRIVREQSPQTPVVWGGVHPSLLPEQTLESGRMDFIILGEGEEEFLGLVLALKKGKETSSLQGLAFRTGENVRINPKGAPIDLDTLDVPSYHLVNLEDYPSSFYGVRSGSLPLCTSRGCPHACRYCYNRAFSNRQWRGMSPKKVLGDLEQLHERFGVKNIYLLDDNFFVQKKRVERICQLLLEKGVGFSFKNANCKAEMVASYDPGFLKLLKEAGFKQLFIGVESGSDEVLEEIGKGCTVSDILAANRKLGEVGITPVYSFMAGFPFETVEQVRKTIRLMDHLLRENPQAVITNIVLYSPFPGTELFDACVKLGMEAPDHLEAWKEVRYDRINHKSFTKKDQQFLERVHYFTVFIDPKYFKTLKNFRTWRHALYSRFIRWRAKHSFFAFMPEMWLRDRIRMRRGGE